MSRNMKKQNKNKNKKKTKKKNNKKKKKNNDNNNKVPVRTLIFFKEVASLTSWLDGTSWLDVDKLALSSGGNLNNQLIYTNSNSKP